MYGFLSLTAHVPGLSWAGGVSVLLSKLITKLLVWTKVEYYSTCKLKAPFGKQNVVIPPFNKPRGTMTNDYRNLYLILTIVPVYAYNIFMR